MVKLSKFIRRNKYVIIFVVFFVWIVFFDETRVSLWLEQRRINNNIEREIDVFNRKTIETERQMEALKTFGDSIEKFAREHFFMKYDNEDIYLFN